MPIWVLPKFPEVLFEPSDETQFMPLPDDSFIRTAAFCRVSDG